MFTTATILAILAFGAIAGISGYLISYRFNASNYAATNRSGDFGSPRGGFFALMSGALIGIILVRLGASFLPVEAVGPGFIASMLAGAAGGITGLIRGQNSRRDQTKKDETDKKDEPKN